MPMQYRYQDKMQAVQVPAKKIPPLPAAPDLAKIKFGEPIDLLENGMDGWRHVWER